MGDAVLAVNAGSSSLKFALFEIDAAEFPQAMFRGLLEGIGTDPHLVVRDGQGGVLVEQRWADGGARTHEDLLDMLIGWIETHLGTSRLVGIGHRVVHGGPDFSGAALLTEEVIAALAMLTPLAPLHQPHSLSPVRAFMTLRPGLPQIACFDTSFHHSIPAVATRLALPRAYAEAGVRRYGFHGLSYEYVALKLQQIAPEIADKRVIVAHLGNGASLCAMQAGRSVDTTMGFTALDGLMMGTRCGSIDPGVVLYMLQQQGLSAQAVEEMLYKRSGLLGVSGISSDMRTLLASCDVNAREAIELFVFRIAREAAALAGSLGGLDAFVFTAGIGEHSPEIRAMVCEKLAWLGPISIQVVPTDEEAMIGRHTMDLLAPE